MQTPWTDERIAELKRLWDGGYSCSQIAAKMGFFTRNAIIGKVHRLDLPGRRSGFNKNGACRSVDPFPPGAPRAKRPKRPTHVNSVFRCRERKPRLGIVNPDAKRSLIPVHSVITGGMISVRGMRRGPAPEMTKTELRNMLETAMQNTAALEFAS